MLSLVWECTSCRNRPGWTGSTTSFLPPLMGRTVSQETSEGYQDLRKLDRRRILLLPLRMANFNSLRRSPAGTTLVIFERTQNSAIVVTQFFQFFGNSAISEDQPSLRREGRTQGSESPRMAREGDRRFPPVGTGQVDPDMPPIDQEMILAGERRS